MSSIYYLATKVNAISYNDFEVYRMTQDLEYIKLSGLS